MGRALLLADRELQFMGTSGCFFFVAHLCGELPSLVLSMCLRAAQLHQAFHEATVPELLEPQELSYPLLMMKDRLCPLFDLLHLQLLLLSLLPSATFQHVAHRPLQSLVQMIVRGASTVHKLSDGALLVAERAHKAICAALK